MKDSATRVIEKKLTVNNSYSSVKTSKSLKSARESNERVPHVPLLRPSW